MENDAERIFSTDYDVVNSKLKSNSYLNHDAFKSSILEHMSQGHSIEVKDLLSKAPDDPKFNDFTHFQFRMFSSNVNKSREEITVSPIALAVCIGDYGMLDSLLGYLTNIKIEKGLEARAMNPPILNNR